MDKNKIRNFAIIAHIDHGKSTLADRILEFTNTVSMRDSKPQMLDTMDLEQERGITIKLNAIQIKYKDYVFHLIDTPGHVDFTYEVSRSLALEHNLEIVPIINKIDLPASDPERVKEEIENVIGIDASDAILISAKTGENIDQVIDAIIKRIPAPKECDNEKPLEALIFDSYFDNYRGVVILVRLFNGSVKTGDEIYFMQSKKVYQVTELGVKSPHEVKKDILEAGEVGWISASIRDIKDINIGDTVTLNNNKLAYPLPGYKKLKPVVYTGFYPVDTRDYNDLKDALEKISLSDSSIVWEPETSKALGFGFRIGFLGLLHMDVLQERLEREFNLDIIATAPSVEFVLTLTNGDIQYITNPSLFPDRSLIKMIEEPYIKASIFLTEEYLGSIMELCQQKRGKYIDIEYLDSTRRKLIYELPLNETIFDFFDLMKSYSKGYASFEYDYIGLRESDLVKVDIMLNGEKIDALAMIVHRDSAYNKSRELTEKLKEVIPRQNFEIPVQAAIGGKIIARETIKAYRKDVTAKLYGGDVTRRQKLLKKQKIGKKRMKSIGTVEVPQEAFLAILKTNTTKKE